MRVTLVGTFVLQAYAKDINSYFNEMQIRRTGTIASVCPVLVHLHRCFTLNAYNRNGLTNHGPLRIEL